MCDNVASWCITLNNSAGRTLINSHQSNVTTAGKALYNVWAWSYDSLPLHHILLAIVTAQVVDVWLTGAALFICLVKV